MTGKDLPSLIELAANAAANGEQYKIKRHADGSMELEAHGEEDHRLMKDALERIGQIDQAWMARDLSDARTRLAAISAASTPALGADPHSKIPAIAISKAVSQWLAEIKSLPRRRPTRSRRPPSRALLSTTVATASNRRPVRRPNQGSP